MHYTEARKGIRSGDLLAWTHRSSPFRSWYDFQIWIVRLAQQSEYSHVGVAWVVGGRVFVLESVDGGVRIFPLSQAGDFYHIEIFQWSEDAERFALAQIGEHYSKWLCVKAFFGLVRRGDTGRWMCAKYVNEVLLRCGVDLGEISMSPGKIVQAALETGRGLTYVRGAGRV